MKFKYVKLPAEEGKFVELPLIALAFPFGSYFCLIDSGADFCVFHGKIGEMLGLDVRKGSYELGVPFGILGREGFFDFFKICFSHSIREIDVNPS